MDRFEKLRISVRYRLLGAASIDKSFQIALDAFDFAENKYGDSKRKDGITPSFMHPLESTGHLFTLLPSIRHPAETLAAMLIHDCIEDHGVSKEECRDRFGILVSDGTFLVSKVVNGIKVDSLPEHFEDMLRSPISTIIKPADRCNNQSTMVGVFSIEKQREYILETEKFIIPMIKKARRIYSDQDSVYENMKFILRNQAMIVNAYK